MKQIVPLRLRLALYLLVLALVAEPAFAQSLRFVPTSYTVQSLHLLLNNPQGIAVDPDGNLFVADTAHSKVWKMDATQTVELYAGNGTAGYTGDGGSADQAELSLPAAVAADLSGNLYIADTGNGAIRRVDAATGVITTIAGGKGSGYSGDGGPATAAKFQKITGLAVDAAGDIFVSDATAGVVREISTSGIISTIAGGGSPASGNGDGGAATSATLQSPWGLAIDASGVLYIAESGAGRVRKVVQGVISTFAGSTVGSSVSGIGTGGPATSARLGSPRGLAVDSAGAVYIADSSLGAAAFVDATGTIYLLAGSAVYGGIVEGGPAIEAGLSSIYGIGVDPFGNVFLASSTQNDLYEVVQHPERFPMTRLGSSSAPQRLVLENTGTTDISLSGIAFSGDFSLSATSNQALYYSPCKSTTTIYAGFDNFCTLDVAFTPTAVGVRTFPLHITSNDTPSTTTVNLTSTGVSAAVVTSGGQLFTVAGNYPGDTNNPGDNISALQATLSEISGLLTDSSGNIYLSEYLNCQVRKVNAKTGIISTFAGLKPNACDSVASSNGDGGPATQATFAAPGSLALGTDGSLYLSDIGHNKIRKINAQGTISTFAGTGSNLCTYQGDGTAAASTAICPEALAIDSKNNLYFTDPQNHAIFKVSSSGIFSKVAGLANNPTGGYSGDGGPALNALLNRPWGIAVDAAGNIYFCDSGNNAVRKIDVATGVITTVAGTPTTSGYSGDGGPATQARLQANYGLAIDSAGNLYIADSGNYVVRKVDAATGIISTVAGSNEIRGVYNGDGLPATEAGLNYPEQVFVDASGHLLVADENNLVRKVDPNGTIRFGKQAVSTTSPAQTLTVSNIGNSALHFDSTTPYSIQGDFALASGGSCDFSQALSPGSSCTLLITFTPTASYNRYGALALFTDGVASPQLTQLEGIGTAPSTPQAVLSPASLTFPSQTLNTTSAPLTVTLSNPGNADLNISAISIAGADSASFSETTSCGSKLAASAQCAIQVSFTPDAARAYSASLTVQDSASNSPQTVPLTGTGVAVSTHSATLAPASLDFSTINVGSTSTGQTLTLTNTGNSTLNIFSIVLGGTASNAFAISNGCGTTLAPAAKCQITVTFTPPSQGQFSATVTVADNATGGSQTAALTGTGAVAATLQAALTPSTANFGNVVVGVPSAAQTFTLTNTGNAAVSISSVAVTGTNASLFALTNGCGASLAAAAQCSISVTFTPTAAGQFSATLSVADNAGGAPQTAALTATGVPAPGFAVSSSTSAQTVNAGDSASFQINVTPTNGNFNLPVSLTASGLPPGATVTFTPPVITPGPNGATSNMVIQTAGRTIATTGDSISGKTPSPGQNRLPITSAIVVVGLLCFRRLPRHSRTKLLGAFLFGAALLSMGLCACGGGFPQPSSGPASHTYTITVTGASGSAQHATTVTLTIR